MTELSHRIAALLTDLGAVTVTPRKPFTWASGLRAPLYCDNRLLISDVAARRLVRDSFAALIRQHPVALIAGTATAGIPHAAWVAEALSLPMVYVRSSEKKHGRKNLIEGRVLPGQKVAVIEDLISTGGSVIRAADALREAGAEVVGIFAIFQYRLEKAVTAFAEAGYPYQTLSDLDALLEVARERAALDDGERASVHEWRRDPKAWSDRQNGG